MMGFDRRSFLQGGAWAGMAGIAQPAFAASGASLRSAAGIFGGIVDVRQFGAKGNGTAIDSGAINKAIDHVAGLGGGTVYFPAGSYASYTIRMKSRVTLFLADGAVLLAAPRPTRKAMTMPNRSGSGVLIRISDIAIGATA
ncbi:glycosyl hydrolase family 28-related protein [Sphingobium scionense]